MSLMEFQESLMSPVERNRCAPEERIHSWTDSVPHWQAEKTISLPQFARASPILR